MVRFSSGRIDPVATDVDLLIVGMPEISGAMQADPSGCALDDALIGTLSHLRAGGIFDGGFGETLVLSSPRPPVRCGSLLVVGMGHTDRITPERLGILAEVAMRAAVQLDGCSIACLLGLPDPEAPVAVASHAARNMMVGALTAIDTHHAPQRFAGMRWTFDLRTPYSANVGAQLEHVIDQWPTVRR
ncbi:MAG TPA: M17 family peptidase N-terminal domain-containing protein [Sphingobium sp.]|nr:M17 family peptidase N-terminal domain-containing protein [Sphingobium sp.]